MGTEQIGPTPPASHISSAQLDWRLISAFKNILTISENEDLSKNHYYEEVFCPRVALKIKEIPGLSQRQIIACVRQASSKLQYDANTQYENTFFGDKKDRLWQMMLIYTEVYNSTNPETLSENQPRWLPQ